MLEAQTQPLFIPLKGLILGAALLAIPALVPAQAAQAQSNDSVASAKPATFLGTVQTMSGSVITVKNDAGATMQVTVDDSARLLRIEPGQKTLGSASPFSLVDLQAGDRVMARGAAGADGKTLAANLLVAIKSADIAQKQAKEREDWQKNGTGGLVKSVDPAAGTITISIGAGGARTEVIHAGTNTILRRYAPGSVKFDQAVKSTLDQVKPGDQLRARGAKGADGSTLEAEEIVSGSFRNVSGAIESVDASGSTITITDSTTKKPIVLTVTPDSEVKKLDPAVAQRLEARMAPGAKRPEGAPSGAPAGPAGGERPAESPAQAGPGARGGGADFQQLLARTPSVSLKDLAKGNMVIVVATEGQTPGTATAITVVAGVEPMLQASTSASQAMVSSSWNLGGGAGGGESSQ